MKKQLPSFIQILYQLIFFKENLKKICFFINYHQMHLKTNLQVLEHQDLYLIYLKDL